MIRHYVDIAVSMKAIERYRVNTGSIVPLVDIISQNYWRQNPLFSENIIHSIVPPIFSKLDLDRATMQLVDLMEEDSDHRPGSVYRPLYDNEPALLEGLISGRFITPPHYGVMVNHPDIRIIPDRWFYVDKVKHQNYISSGYTHINHPYFDAIALSLVGMRPSSLSIMTTLSSAIDGLMDLSVTRYFKDPYTQFHPLSSTYMSSVREVISKLLAESVMIYCQIYDIDYSCFMEEKTVQSSICIEKNIYDEVSISIHDLVNDRYTCFYSYIPPLILATMGVGMYLDER